MEALAVIIIAAAAEREQRRDLAAEMRLLRDTANPFSIPEGEFVKLFRLSKAVAHHICDSLRENLMRQRTHGLSVESQVLAALRFFAIGSYQRCVGQDNLIAMSQPSVSRCIQAVAMGIIEELSHQWIQFPTSAEERRSIKQKFRTVRGLKGVIGCVDCTHVAIIRPKENEAAYLNHKGYHSLNIQVVATNDLRITGINPRFPGSTHDAFIWRYSAIREEMMRKWDLGDHTSWILGDSGYPLEPWLMTPIINPPEGSPESRYNQAHCHTRNCVERTFGVLKNTFRCLLKHRTLHYQPVPAASIVVACATLHNMRLHDNLGNANIDVDGEAEAALELANVEPQNVPPHNQPVGERQFEAVRIRNTLVRNFQHQ